MRETFVERVEAAVKAFHSKDVTGHDWWHINRVRNTALKIAEHMHVDIMLVEVTALIHDVSDYKIHKTEDAGERALRELLEKCEVPPSYVEQAMDIARRVSFKGSGVKDDMPTIEGKIVQDADRLDALGPIGIARTFAYGGAKGRPMYDPERPIELEQTTEQYLNASKEGTTIHHIYEKLVLLKDRLHTDRAKYMAEELDAFLILFLKAFHRQWNGEF